MARATKASTFNEKMADPYYDWAQEDTNLGNDIVSQAKAVSNRMSMPSQGVAGTESFVPGAASPSTVQGAYDRDKNIAHDTAIEARGPDYTYGDVARETAVGAAMIPAFMSGVPGAVGGGILALDSLRNAVKDPSLTNVGGVALGAIGPMRAAMKLRAATEVPSAYQVFSGMRGMPGVAPKAARGTAQAISHNEMPLASEAERAVNSFVNQTPDVADAAETVTAPGFGLGNVTPMNQVPTSRAKMAADAMKQSAQKRAAENAIAQQRRAAQSVNEGTMAGFSDLTDEEINAAMENGYTYGEGIPVGVRRRR